MKRAFIRALWGVPPVEWDKQMSENYKINKDNIFVKSRLKAEKTIYSRLTDEFTIPFRTYVFGKDNYKFLETIGIKDLVMIDEQPLRYSPNGRPWWHKLDVLKYAMEEDHYDEIVYLDWDCYLIKELKNNFWEALNKKEHFQACLMRYRRANILNSRNTSKDNSIVPNGGFVYIRGKNVPGEIIKFRDVGPNKWLDEAAYAKYLDYICGGWIGAQDYWERFEPEHCQFKRSIFSKRKDSCFRHR